MPGIPFIRDFKFDYGTAMEVTPHIRRVVARNPGPFTFKGTGTYIIGHGKVAIVDPGPDQQDHIDAVLNAVRGETVTRAETCILRCFCNSGATRAMRSTKLPRPPL